MDNEQLLGIDVAVWGNVSISIAEMMIVKGANVNAKDINRKTPLHFAASEGNTKVVELLIVNGANVNAMNNGNFTPLSYAIQNRHDDIAALLRPYMDNNLINLEIYCTNVMNGTVLINGTNLYVGSYVRDHIGEIFIVLGEKDYDHVYIKDKDGKHSIIYKTNITLVDKDDPAILKYFP